MIILFLQRNNFYSDFGGFDRLSLFGIILWKHWNRLERFQIRLTARTATSFLPVLLFVFHVTNILGKETVCKYKGNAFLLPESASYSSGTEVEVLCGKERYTSKCQESGKFKPGIPKKCNKASYCQYDGDAQLQPAFHAYVVGEVVSTVCKGISITSECKGNGKLEPELPQECLKQCIYDGDVELVPKQLIYVDMLVRLRCGNVDLGSSYCLRSGIFSPTIPQNCTPYYSEGCTYNGTAILNPKLPLYEFNQTVFATCGSVSFMSKCNPDGAFIPAISANCSHLSCSKPKSYNVILAPDKQEYLHGDIVTGKCDKLTKPLTAACVNGNFVPSITCSAVMTNYSILILMFLFMLIT